MANETQTPVQSDAWIAENPGDSITGQVVDLDTAWSDYRARQTPSDPQAGNYPILKIRTEDGAIKTVHAFRTVLFNEVMKRQPLPGETITITFTGFGKERDGMDRAHIYSLETPNRDPEKVARNVYGRIPGAPAPVAESDVPVDTEDIPF